MLNSRKVLNVYGRKGLSAFKRRPWSKLQKELYLIRAEGIRFQIHCRNYPFNGATHRTQVTLPRYWITLDKEIIWDYPRDFKKPPYSNDPGSRKKICAYPYFNEVSDISALIREYLDTPKDQLMSKHFENDHWGLINILRAADRRIGQRRLKALKSKTRNKAARKIIEQRMNKAESSKSD